MFVSSRLQYLVVEAPLPSDNKQNNPEPLALPSSARPAEPSSESQHPKKPTTEPAAAMKRRRRWWCQEP